MFNNVRKMRIQKYLKLIQQGKGPILIGKYYAQYVRKKEEECRDFKSFLKKENINFYIALKKAKFKIEEI